MVYWLFQATLGIAVGMFLSRENLLARMMPRQGEPDVLRLSVPEFYSFMIGKVGLRCGAAIIALLIGTIACLSTVKLPSDIEGLGTVLLATVLQIPLTLALGYVMWPRKEDSSDFRM